MSTAEKPFQIAVPDDDILNLKQKLRLTRFPDELDGAGWDYGSPLSDIQRLVKRWASDEYDWRAEEKKLNDELPQFTRDVEVEGFGALNIHYIHKRSSVATATPLLFMHGWPGSFIEVRKILPLLVEVSAEHPSFHAVALSHPGFGFSEAPKKPGFELTQYAEVAHKLMISLGYDEYVIQGGDWGQFIARRMAKVYGPKHAKAWHTNFPMAPPPHPIHRPLLLLSHFLWGYSEKEKEGLRCTQDFRTNGSGYYAQQSTRPQTLGYSLADSPAGLLAWIYEKLVQGTDEYPWTDDEVLTWLSIYWFSRAGPAASVRIYYEVVKVTPGGLNSLDKTTIPMGHSYFPKEGICMPRRWLRAPNLVFESEHEHGGHFAAYEKPEALVGDLHRMFGSGGPAYGVVPGKNGYA